MKVNREQLSLIVALWIKNDPLIWSQLRDIQINLLVERMVKGTSIKEIAQRYRIEDKRIEQMILAIILRIEQIYGKDIAEALRSIHRELKGISMSRIEIDFNQIFLN